MPHDGGRTAAGAPHRAGTAEGGPPYGGGHAAAGAPHRAGRPAAGRHRTVAAGAPDPGGEPGSELPFFVYGTLRPGGRNHGRYLAGRTVSEEPARLPGALLHDGPGYPYLRLGGTGTVVGDLVRAAPGGYRALLDALDRLEGRLGPGDPRNLYERVVCGAVRARDGAEVRAWVYVAAARTVVGPPLAGGDWLSRPTGPGRSASPVPGGPRTP